MIDNTNSGLLGKVLGRLGCGGALHYDTNMRDWPGPLEIEITIGGEKVLQLPITGWECRREQAGIAATRLVFTASEPD
jgi:hypothetical protein